MPPGGTTCSPPSNPVRTAQLVVSAAALALAAGVVVVLVGVSNVPGLEFAALHASIALLPPFWCLLSWWLARTDSWKMGLTLLLIAAWVGLFALGLLLDMVEESRGAFGGRPTYLLHLSIDVSLILMIPLGLLSLLLGGVARWRRWRTDRAAAPDDDA